MLLRDALHVVCVVLPWPDAVNLLPTVRSQLHRRQGARASHRRQGKACLLSRFVLEPYYAFLGGFHVSTKKTNHVV